MPACNYDRTGDGGALARSLAAHRAEVDNTGTQPTADDTRAAWTSLPRSVPDPETDAIAYHARALADGALCADCLDDLTPYTDCPPCAGCGLPIVSDDPDRCHTPGTDRYHAACCPDCQGDPARQDVLGLWEDAS